jgi:hypothetical protein
LVVNFNDVTTFTGPSRTALTAAAARAAHLLVDAPPFIFEVDHPATQRWTGNSYAERVGAAAAERGEPWLTFLSPAEIAALLARHGIEPAEHVHQRDAVDAALWQRSDSLHPIELSVLTRATVTAPPPRHGA